VSDVVAVYTGTYEITTGNYLHRRDVRYLVQFSQEKSCDKIFLS